MKSQISTKSTRKTVKSKQVHLNVARGQRVTVQSSQTIWDKLNSTAEANQSKLSMVLGALIILIVGILVFNFFNKQKATLGPSQTTEAAQNSQNQSYKVQEGDTLFSIAEKYYKDGYKYPELAQANNLTNPDLLEVGSVLNIPKASPEATLLSNTSSSTRDTQWGPAITSGTYTVVDGDWLSTIAGRAYGDTAAFTKIAEANNINNPDIIESGTVLKIPR